MTWEASRNITQALQRGFTVVFPSGSAHYNFKHGLSGTRTHQSWTGMISRCTNPNQKQYCDYGGRGIKVCQRWADSYLAFLEDMGERPEGTSIDRIDCNGDYTPENCRWATDKEQARNTRKNRFLEFNGETRSVSEWAEITGNDAITIVKRLRRGWTVEKALTMPRLQNGHRSGRTDLQNSILDQLKGGSKRCADIAKNLMKSAAMVHGSLTVMLDQGIVARVSRGVFVATGHEPVDGFAASGSTFYMNARNTKCPACKWVARRATSACGCESTEGIDCGCRWGKCSKCGASMILSELYWKAVRSRKELRSWFQSCEARSALAEIESRRKTESMPLTKDR